MTSSRSTDSSRPATEPVQAVPPSNRLTAGPLRHGLLRLAGPMFASAMLQNALSLIDLFWVGRLGSESVAALAVSGTILMLLFPAVMGMSTGTVAIVSRCIGAGQREEASRVAAQSLTAALVFGLAAGGAGFLYAAPLCRLLGAEGHVVALGAEYLRISFLGCVTMVVLFIGNSILQAAGQAVVPMRAMLLANALNLLLDPVFIFGLAGLPALGVGGAALATVLSQTVAMVWVVGVLARGHSGIHAPFARWGLRRDILWRLARIGVPSSGQMLSRSLMSAVLMRIVATCGATAVAAYGIGMRFHMIVLMPAFVLGNAVSTMVGQNLGAERPDRAQRVSWLATGLDVLIMAASAVVMFAFAAPLVRLFDRNPEVIAIGARYLRITSPFHIFAAFSIVLGRAMQGAGDTVSPMVTTILGLWVVQVPLALAFAQWFSTPTDGIFWSIAITLLVNGLMVAAWFATGRWKRRGV